MIHCNRQRISPIKNIIVTKKIMQQMWQLARDSFPNEYARFMIGEFPRKRGKSKAVYDTIIVKELFGEELSATDHSFKFAVNSSRDARKYAAKKGMHFIGTIHSHPSQGKLFDIAQLLISGMDSFYMYRICEPIRGIVALNDSPEGFLIFWAFGKHTPIKINNKDSILNLVV